MRRKKPGYFVVFEGADGSGQDTQADLLAEHLRLLGHNVLRTGEPTDSSTGKEIREILSGRMLGVSKLGLQKLMVNDRGVHLSNVILPHMHREGVVVCVRYFYSTLVYGQADGLAYDELWELNEHFRRPDLTIFLDLDPKISLERVKKRAAKTGQPLDIFEKEKFLEKVRNNFLALQESGDFPEMVTVDASGTPDEVHQRIITMMN